MRERATTVWTIGCLAALAAALLAPRAAAQSDGQAAGLPADVADHLVERVEEGDHPGVVVGLVDADGARVYAFGQVDNERDAEPTADTIYEIGSITKAFTGLLLAEMVESGMVELDDPVAMYLPDSVSMPGGEAITLEHLATHTSGLPSLPTNLAPGDPANPYADYSADQLHEFLSQYELEGVPGTAYRYSNLGIGLLGHALALRAGVPFETLIEERITDPLDLDDTAVSLTAAERERLAPGYSGGRPAPAWDIPALTGSAALLSDASDMLDFLAAHLGTADSPLDGATRLAMEVRPVAELADDAAARNAGTPDRLVALAWRVHETSDGTIMYQGGGTGGYRAFAGLDPESGRGVVVLTNVNLDIDDVGFHLLDPEYPLTEIRRAVDVPVETLEEYEGVYEVSPFSNIIIWVEGGRLYGQIIGQQPFAMYADSPSNFFLRIVDAEIAFQRNELGEVTSLSLSQRGRRIHGEKIN